MSETERRSLEEVPGQWLPLSREIIISVFSSSNRSFTHLLALLRPSDRKPASGHGNV